MWLGILVGTVLMISVVACCTFMPSGTNDAYAAGAEVNLEVLTKAYADHVRSESKDLSAFETRVNKPDIYSGKEYVRVTMNEQGSVVGYTDDNGQAGYQPTDNQVFVVDADKESQQLVARDRGNRHYGMRTSDIFTFYLMSRMLSTQRGYYGGRYYRPPTSAKWVQSGYHTRLKSSSSSRSTRSGSSGTRRGAGGFGSGK